MFTQDFLVYCCQCTQLTCVYFLGEITEEWGVVLNNSVLFMVSHQFDSDREIGSYEDLSRFYSVIVKNGALPRLIAFLNRPRVFLQSRVT